MADMQGNPTGEQLASAGWVDDVITAWAYPEAEKLWFREGLRTVPQDARVAGGFTTNLFELLRRQGHNPQDCLSHLHFTQLPNKFRQMPLNHFQLSLVEIMHRLGEGRCMEDDARSVQAAINRGMAAALIRTTLPGLMGGNRLGEILRLIAKAFSGILFSHARLSVLESGPEWILQHRNEHHFLAHWHYPIAYRELVSGASVELQHVRFVWLDETSADVHFSLRPSG
jgi:hypothetical protein